MNHTTNQPTDGLIRPTATANPASGMDGWGSWGWILSPLAIAAVLDIAFFYVLCLGGIGQTSAHLLSFLAGVVALGLSSFRRFGREADAGGQGRWPVILRSIVILLLAMFLRGAVLGSLVEACRLGPVLAILPAVVVSILVCGLGFVFFVVPTPTAGLVSSARPGIAAVLIVAYVLALRLAHVGLVDLIPQESYYWLYAQHMDTGYLDHPPMVAWLIGLGTAVAGDTEFGVRLPAYLCWLVAAVFMAGLARNLFDKASALQVLTLLAVLPIYFSIGVLMTPDAPLYACWAGGLFFLERALLAQKKWAWYGFGACLGVGLLSKYTIILLVPAALVFILLDRPSRRWLARPEPYLAVLVAAILFSPVILWNSRNEWASFVFQGPRRLSEGPAFSLHHLVLSALVLLTPVVLAGITRCLFFRQAGGDGPESLPGTRKPGRLFALAFVLTPLLPFVLFSIGRGPKLNWTGPVWLAALPLVGWWLVARPDSRQGRFEQWARRCWMPTCAALLLFYSGSLYYFALGMPGLSPGAVSYKAPVLWDEVSAHIERVEEQVEAQTGARPLVVGMEKHYTSSAIAFYQAKNQQDDERVSGVHLFDRKSLMFAFWEPKSLAIGRDVVMIAFKRARLSAPSLDDRFTRLGPLMREPVIRDGRVLTYMYWRIGYDYRG